MFTENLERPPGTYLAEMGEPRGSFDVVRTINMVREPCEANHVGEPKMTNSQYEPNHANHGSQVGSFGS